MQPKQKPNTPSSAAKNINTPATASAAKVYCNACKIAIEAVNTNPIPAANFLGAASPFFWVNPRKETIDFDKPFTGLRLPFVNALR